jgi:hypothetical protein
MAALTAQDVSSAAGSTVVYSAANASDTWLHTGQTAKLLVRTGATAGITVTITTYKTINGLTVPNRSIAAIPASTDKVIPLDKDLYANPTGGLVTIGTSPTTNVTTAIIVG